MVVNSYDIDLSYLTLDGTCIILDLSWDCTISRCTISSVPGDGVYLSDCSGNIIDACSITSSAATGIALEATTTTTISNNLLQDNTDEEIFIYGDSMGNQIYYNQIYVGLESVKDNGFSNTWDNGVSYGNWWSDYGGTGTYTIPGTAGSVDNYPRGPSSTDTTPPPLPTTTTPLSNYTTTPGLGGVLIRSWTPMDLTIRVVLVLAIGMIYGALVVLFIKRLR